MTWFVYECLKLKLQDEFRTQAGTSTAVLMFPLGVLLQFLLSQEILILFEIPFVLCINKDMMKPIKKCT